MSKLPTIEELCKLVTVDAQSGTMSWKPRGVEMFKPGPSQLRAFRSWNSRYSGKKAFASIDGNGYFSGAIFNRSFYAHRVIWAVHYGEWPKHEIDHINGIKLDNRIINLRSVTHKNNSKNAKISDANTSGVTGVSYNRNSRKFEAYVTSEGKKVHIGVFNDLELAKSARSEANEKYGFHKNHGERP